jgi:hypothetical protein
LPRMPDCLRTVRGGGVRCLGMCAGECQSGDGQSETDAAPAG